MRHGRPGSGVLLLRAVVFAVASVTLAVLAHVAAHGAAPTSAAVAGDLLLSVEAGLLLGPRERRWSVLLTVLGLCQLGSHVLFTALALDAPGHGHAAPQLSFAAGAVRLDGSALMVASHAAVTLVVAAGLRCGERALWAVVRSLAPARVLRVLDAVRVLASRASAPRLATPPTVRLWTPHDLLDRPGALRRRGPPALPCVATAG